MPRAKGEAASKPALSPADSDLLQRAWDAAKSGDQGPLSEFEGVFFRTCHFAIRLVPDASTPHASIAFCLCCEAAHAALGQKGNGHCWATGYRMKHDLSGDLIYNKAYDHLTRGKHKNNAAAHPMAPAPRQLPAVAPPALLLPPAASSTTAQPKSPSGLAKIVGLLSPNRKKAEKTQKLDIGPPTDPRHLKGNGPLFAGGPSSLSINGAQASAAAPPPPPPRAKDVLENAALPQKPEPDSKRLAVEVPIFVFW